VKNETHYDIKKQRYIKAIQQGDLGHKGTKHYSPRKSLKPTSAM